MNNRERGRKRFAMPMTNFSHFWLQGDLLEAAIGEVLPIHVRKLRTDLGLSGQDFGVMLGFAPSCARGRLSEIERGARPISRQVALLYLYIEAFGPLSKLGS